MALTKRVAVTAFSSLYLLLLVLISAYNLHTIRLHSLPIPHTLAAFTLALPAIAGLTLESLINGVRPSQAIKLSRNTNTRSQSQSRYSSIALLALFVYETVLATLAGTYLPSSSTVLNCGIDTKWKDLYRKKNGKAIQQIQDAFDCCGLHSPLDMAYPFPRKGVGADACKATFGRERSCFGAWKGEERKVAGLMLMVVLLVALWKVVILVWQSRGRSWFSHVVETVDEDAENQTNGQRALGYPDREGRYLDQPPAAVEEEIDESQDGRVEDGTLVHSRVQPSQLHESDQWASERRE